MASHLASLWSRLETSRKWPNNPPDFLQAVSDFRKTKAVLTDNYISNNHYGICVKKDDKTYNAASEDPEHGVEIEMSNNVFEDNIYGDISHVLVNED